MNTPVSDLGPLAGLTGLQSLNLFNTPVRDLGPLAGLYSLNKVQFTPQQRETLDLRRLIARGVEISEIPF